MRIRRRFTLTDPLGLHARDAARLARLFAGSAGDVWVFYGDRKVNGKSAAELLKLEAPQSTQLEIDLPEAPAEALLNALSEIIGPAEES